MVLWGPQVAPRARRAWAVLPWLSVLYISVALVLVTASPLERPGGQQAARCRLNILGGAEGRLQQASMSCTGPTTAASVALNTTYLAGFQAKFTGINLAASCNARSADKYPCLITICAGAVVLQDSTVSWVRGIPVAGLVCLVHDSRLEVYNSRFSKNGVRPVMVGDQASMVLYNSNVNGNMASGSGGGLLVWDNASAHVMGGSSVYNNTAGAGGGGVAVAGNASLLLTGRSSVHGNMAANSNAGGVWVADRAEVTLSSSSVYNNTSHRSGGGMHAQDASKVTISNSSVHGNTARKNGGGLCGMDTTTWIITGGSSIHNNVGHWDGGGLFAQDASKVTIANSCVHSNTARHNGGGLLGTTTTMLTIGGSSIHNNTAHRGGGGIRAKNASKVAITNSSVHNNFALTNCGGGFKLRDAMMLNITSSSVHSNTAARGGGGICASQGATVAIRNHSTVHSNRAHGSGGGLATFNGAVLTITGDCTIANNSCIGGIGGGLCVGVVVAVEGVKIAGLGRLERDAGPKQGRVVDRVTISGSTIANNTSHRGAGGGLAVAAGSVVHLRHGSVLYGNRAINGSGGAVLLTDNAVLEADGTVVFLNNGVQPPNYVGSTAAAFGNSSLSLPMGGTDQRGHLTKCNTSVYLGRTPCGVGETLQHDVCICCPPHTYGFANSSCTQCPPNAVCPGANIVEPLPGFWSSAPTSIQMHRCPLFKSACDYVNKTHVCRPGYQGPLCGACQLPEYGMLSPMRCGRCMPPTAQFGLYVALSLVTVLFVAYTVHATWQDNLQGNREVLISDYIKVLVQFLQYIVIIGSVSVPWPLFDVQQWLQTMGVVVTMGLGQALSVDCWLYSRQGILPIAIQRQLVYLLAPVFTFVAVVVLQCLLWAVQRWLARLCRKRRHNAGAQSPLLLLQKLPVTVLVLVYYAYPILSRASLSFFACLNIDEPLGALRVAPEGATAPLTHPWGYWVSSIEQQCFAGYHLGWAMGLGLPSVLLWCLAIPVAMGVGLYLCRDRADNDSFRQHFGFLYRNYKPERMWWEAVWAARTVVLTLTSVFSFPMQRYFSVLSLLVVFLVSAALQIVLQPYAVATLHQMHLVSTACLAASTMGALAMFAYDIQESTAYTLRITITVLVFVINLAFVAWCCEKLAPVLKERCADFFAVSKAWVLRAVAGHPTGRSRARTCRIPRAISGRVPPTVGERVFPAIGERVPFEPSVCASSQACVPPALASRRSLPTV